MELYIYKRLIDLDNCIIYTSTQKEVDIYISHLIVHGNTTHIKSYSNTIDNMMSDYDIYLMIRDHLTNMYDVNIYHTNYDTGKYVYLKNRTY